MTDPTPLQLMDRLLDALREAGIGWCQWAHAKDSNGKRVLCFEQNLEKAESVCMSGAIVWARISGILRDDEARRLRYALDRTVFPDKSITYVNDDGGWDFARFREELAMREGEGRQQ